MEILSEIPFEPNTEEIMDHLRVAPDSADADDLRLLLEQAREVARPKAVCDVCYVGDRTSDTVDIEGITFSSRVLRVNLEDAHRVFPHVATCGRELDEMPGVAGDPIRVYWMDAIKVAALRVASARVREHIVQKHQPGKTSSMSPGSLEDWPITQQTQLFSLLGDVEGAIGVTLTDSFLMVPTKSVSAMLFPTETSFDSCRLCPREDCPGRAAPYDEHLWDERYAEAPSGGGCGCE
jgi:hypothetical protein